MLVRKFLAKNKTVIIPQPPYSPDFLKLKISMKGKHFVMIEEIKEKSKLLAIPKNTFQKCFEDW